MIHYPTACIDMPLLFQGTLIQVDAELQIMVFQKSPQIHLLNTRGLEEVLRAIEFSTKIIKDCYEILS